MNAQPRYNVEISPVREVALRGVADFAFWKDRLQGEGLVPAGDGDRAQLLLIAVDSQFMGLRFRELSISVFVGQISDGGEPDAVFLVHAFNSSRLFAFVERTFYHTPYYHADVRVETRRPASFEVGRRKDVILRAEMSGSSIASRTLVRCGEEGWEGPILLPSAASFSKPKVFFAKLGGHTHVYPFAADDVVMIKSTAAAPVLRWLVESEFVGTEWSIRENATHARSKSVKRSSVQLFPAGQAG